MKSKITIDGLERTFITDETSLRKFIKDNENSSYECAIITPNIAKRFNPLSYIDSFRVSDERFCSGHGSTDSVPYIIAPSVCKCQFGQEVWYELHIGHCASRETLENMIKTITDMKMKTENL